MSEALKQKVLKEIDSVLAETIEFRHSRHEKPELTWQEKETSETVADTLSKIPGVSVQKGVGKLGVVGTLKGDKPGPVVALRADMDALPILEKTTVPYKSKNEGSMHACGHDGHMANLMGSAKVLSRFKSELRGTIKFVFQPAEEGGAGARSMRDDGVLTSPKVDAIFGLHGWPELEVGKIFVRTGPIAAAHAVVKVTVTGTGGHAAMPHLVTDQVLAAAKFIDAIQSIRSRSFSPADPMALTISTIHGGKALNVIPDEVLMTGTLRTVTKEGETLAIRRIKEIGQGIALQTGTQFNVEVTPSYPATVNHEKETAWLEKIAQEALGKENVVRMPAPTMGAEDFSFFLESAPGSFFLLGLNDGRSGGYPSLHDPRFDFNDQSLKTGMRLYTHLALFAADHL